MFGFVFFYNGIKQPFVQKKTLSCLSSFISLIDEFHMVDHCHTRLANYLQTWISFCMRICQDVCKVIQYVYINFCEQFREP